MYPHRKETYSPDKNYRPQDDAMQRLRNTMKVVEAQRATEAIRLRNSYSASSIRYLEPLELSQSLTPKRKNTVTSLKDTLDKLENKLNNAKHQLQVKPVSVMMPKKTKKYITLDTEELEQSRYQRPTDSMITQKKADISLTKFVTSVPKPNNMKTFNFNPYSPRRHNHYYISQVLRAKNQKNSLAMEHVISSIKILKACQMQDIPQNVQIQHRKLNLKKKEFYKGKKTLILDLDQTLIHCIENYQMQSDMKLPIKIDANSTIDVGINIRPYAISFLKKMATKFEIIIFTASHSSYADVVLNQLDPERQIFQHRLYRQHCFVLQNQLHVKDLRIINRSMSQMVLVDNAAYSYAFQLENGIPILPFYEGSDYELSALEGYLDRIEKAQDVREVNKKYFKLHHYSKFTSSQELVEQVYSDSFF